MKKLFSIFLLVILASITSLSKEIPTVFIWEFPKELVARKFDRSLVLSSQSDTLYRTDSAIIVYVHRVAVSNDRSSEALKKAMLETKSRFGVKSLDMLLLDGEGKADSSSHRFYLSGRETNLSTKSNYLLIPLEDRIGESIQAAAISSDHKTIGDVYATVLLQRILAANKRIGELTDEW